MKTLFQPVSKLSDYKKIKSLLLDEKKPVGLFGCVDSQKVHIASALTEECKIKLVVTYSEIRAKEIYSDFLLYEPNCVIFPAKDLIFYQADIHSNNIAKQRLMCYRKILENKNLIVVTSFAALMNVQIPLCTLKENCINIKQLDEINIAEFSMKLVKMGYEKTHQVEVGGQFSVRGNIIDVFDLTEENPCRIELWGEQVESVRMFDALSQRSVEVKSGVTIFPATELILSDSEIEDGVRKIDEDLMKSVKAFRDKFLTEEAHRLKTNINQLKEEILEFKNYINLEGYIRYFYKDVVSFIDLFDENETTIVLDEQSRIMEHANAIELEFRESMSGRLLKGYILSRQADIIYSIKEVLNIIKKYPLLSISVFDTLKSDIKLEDKFDIGARSIHSYQNDFVALCKELKRYKKEKYSVVIMSSSRTRAKRIAQNLMDEDIIAFYSEDKDRIVAAGEIMTTYGGIKRGFEYPLLKFVVISESDIFNTIDQRKKPKSNYQGQKIKEYTELSIGDYVVHEGHGLGIYRGIEKIEVRGITQDYIKIEYAGGSEFCILATRLDAIQKYASVGAKKPKLNKIGSKEWVTTKNRVRENVAVVAKELVQLYSKRQEEKGYQFSEDTEWQREFEELFPYRETDDQISAIEDTKADMESPKIMDRLICGDVGYGKTEIALRAAFKAVTDGKQVAYLVPTTILAQQHYNTFAQRMKDFPIRIQLLSRFKTQQQQKEAISQLKKGELDIVIGTHRLLSKDVEFNDLGLLIVDEEQRFGVTHKEKIKHLKQNIDVITLTATPIPRTLHMSLIGIRDMSLLEEAPNERLPIQTYIMEYDDEMVREAIVREIARGGQVFYVHNRVAHIADVTARISELVPDANVVYAHGQMEERELERIMYLFVNGEIDVLISTTIIETGLDISNANTIIIQDSDNFGLSQLYQLRGRVGRSNRNAFAFLLYKKDKVLKEIAEKRLQAIREFTNLGSGFKIAMRDLEIRGAGNLLGMRQHGHMDAVGYELYCKMLNSEVSKLKGEVLDEEFETIVDCDIDAFIPPSYILNELQKLDIYKRIAAIKNEVECDEMRDELLDRFGEIPQPVNNLLEIPLIRAQSHKLYIEEIECKIHEIKIIFKADGKIDPNKIPILLEQYKGELSFVVKPRPTLYYKNKESEKKILEVIRNLLLNMRILLYTVE